MNKSEKLGKKEKKKLKAKEKEEQNESKPNKELAKEQKLAQIDIKYGRIPIIPTASSGKDVPQEMKVVKTKNKKLGILVMEVTRVLVEMKTVEIIGQDLEIPKTVSLAEIPRVQSTNRRMCSVVMNKRSPAQKQQYKSKSDIYIPPPLQTALRLHSVNFKQQLHQSTRQLGKLINSLPIIKFIKQKMSLHEVQKLTRQNRKLQQELKSLTHQLSMLQNKQKMHEQLNRKWNKQKEFLNQQIRELRRRQEQSKYEKQETQNRYLNVLRKMEDQLEQRKDKYQRLESKIQPLVDHDTVRLKILNEVEGVHFMQLEEFKRKNNQLKDEILKLKRQNQVYKHEIENNRIDFEDQKRRIKYCMQDKSKTDHLNELSYEMCMQLQNRMRMNYDQARKQADYYKDKYFSSQKKYQDRISQLEKQNNLFKQQLSKH